jgi:hypothetical protein
MAAERCVLLEVRETMTDPHLDGWYDSAGLEADDKCRTFTFTEPAPAPPPYYSRHFTFGLQQEWSNAVHGGVGETAVALGLTPGQASLLRDFPPGTDFLPFRHYVS